MKAALPFIAVALGLSACEIDTSALQEVQDTAAQAQAAAEVINTRTAEVQQAIENPGGALLAAVGATFTKTATDLQTGCQFLATYAGNGTTVSSIAPRVEAVAGGGTRQRCVVVPGLTGPEAAEAAG